MVVVRVNRRQDIDRNVRIQRYDLSYGVNNIAVRTQVFEIALSVCVFGCLVLTPLCKYTVHVDKQLLLFHCEISFQNTKRAITSPKAKI